MSNGATVWGIVPCVVLLWIHRSTTKVLDRIGISVNSAPGRGSPVPVDAVHAGSTSVAGMPMQDMPMQEAYTGPCMSRRGISP